MSSYYKFEGVPFSRICDYFRKSVYRRSDNV